MKYLLISLLLPLNVLAESQIGCDESVDYTRKNLDFYGPMVGRLCNDFVATKHRMWLLQNLVDDINKRFVKQEERNYVLVKKLRRACGKRCTKI